MSEQNSMQAMSERAERLINAYAGALLSAGEAAARRVELASRVASEKAEAEAEVATIILRMTAFSAVLEAIDAQKQRLLTLRQTAQGARAQHIDRQIDLLTHQETAVLERSGVSTEQAQKAVALLDAPADQETDACGRQPRKRIVQRNGVAQG